MKTFTFEALGIADVLKKYELVVPLYQREYAWEKRQVERLFQDLSAGREKGEYFLGTLVTIEKDKNVLEVVDGQQRLTTTTLLLAAMRDYLLKIENAEHTVKAIEDHQLNPVSRRANSTVPRLRLNVDDNDYFLKLIARNGLSNTGTPRRDSHQRLADAAKQAQQAVRAMVGGQSINHHLDVINGWLDYLEDDASVILLVAPDGGQAFRMFETLNDRGMKTTQADLVKSFLFGEAGKRINEAQSKWSAMQAHLEDVDDDARSINYLRHFLIATRKFVRANDIFKTVQEPIKGESSAIVMLSELEDTARTYAATFRADSEFWNGYSKTALNALRAINRFGIAPLRPVLLAIASKFSPSETATAFSFLVSLSVRSLLAASTRTGSFEETAAESARKIYKGDVSTTKQLKESLFAVTPNDSEFEDGFKAASSTKPEYARYYLRTLEQSFAQVAEPWHIENDDPSQITLEHILPKSPGPEWPEWKDPEQVKRYSRRIGNLCLLQRSTNSNRGSEGFEAKRPDYKAASYTFTSSVADYAQWTPAEIEARQATMAAQAVKAWPI